MLGSRKVNPRELKAHDTVVLFFSAENQTQNPQRTAFSDSIFSMHVIFISALKFLAK